MSNPIERLIVDHQNFASLLDILERQLDHVAATKDENFEVMRDVMHYMTRYSDMIHHPMEDLVYARLADKAPKARDDLAAVPSDHERLNSEGAALYESLKSIADGEMVLRDSILTQGRNYVEHLRKHMVLEERHLFPRAKEVLDERDLSEVERILDEQRDPVFGPVVENDFRDLFDFIKNEDTP